MSKHVGMTKCPTCGRRPKRGTQQNRLYWLLIHVIADKAWSKEGRSYSADTWHLHFRKTFLGAKDYDIPGGQTLTIPNSTADLSVDEFSDYVGKVEAWAAEQGIYLDELTT